MRSKTADVRVTTAVFALCRQADALAARKQWRAALLLYELASEQLGDDRDQSGGGRPAYVRDADIQRTHGPAASLAISLRCCIAARLEQRIGRELTELAPLKKQLRPLGWAMAVALGSILIGALAWHAVYLRELSNGARWRASSAAAGLPRTGRLPDRKLTWAEPDFFFHTKQESRPWLLIDLGSVHELRAIEIVNRLDCCFERARQLDIELSRDGTTFEKVAGRNAQKRLARRWRKHFVARAARFVRIASLGDVPLHFADVRILGR